MKSDPLWKIRDPALFGNPPVLIGDNAITYAYAIDNSGAFVKHNQDLPFFSTGVFGSLSNYPYNPSLDFSNTYSRSGSAATLWHGVAYQNGGFVIDQMGFFQALASICNCIYEPANASNLIIQQGVDALQNTLNNIYQAVQNATNNFISNLPSWLQAVATTLKAFQTFFNALWNVANVAIDAAQNLYNHFSMALNTGLVVNTTDYRLYQSTKFHSVQYFECEDEPQIPKQHIGSTEYFGLLTKDILRYNLPSQNLPNWVQLVSLCKKTLHRTVINNFEYFMKTKVLIKPLISLSFSEF